MKKAYLIFASLISSVCFANEPDFSSLEKTYHGRFGVFAITPQSTIEYRANERFPFDSTFKVMLVAAILKQGEADPALLDKVIHYSQADIDTSGYAPITALHLKTGMTIEALCEAAIEYSDNAAGNLLIDVLGGPQAVNNFAKSIGNRTFTLDRLEPALNENLEGDLRDTSTPESMAESLQKIALGNVLEEKQRALLQTWLKANTTGKERIRSSVPQDWVVGDKTGTGQRSSADLAILWPHNGSPWILAVYFESENASPTEKSRVIAEAAKRVLNDRKD